VSVGRLAKIVSVRTMCVRQASHALHRGAKNVSAFGCYIKVVRVCIRQTKKFPLLGNVFPQTNAIPFPKILTTP